MRPNQLQEEFISSNLEDFDAQARDEARQFKPTDTTTKRKRLSRQLVSMDFGSQDVTADAMPVRQDYGGVDLVTPPWLQDRLDSDSQQHRAGCSAGSKGQWCSAAAVDGPAIQPAQRSAAPGATAQQALPQIVLSEQKLAAGSAADLEAGDDIYGHRTVGEPHQHPKDISYDTSSDDFEPPSTSRRTSSMGRCPRGGTGGSVSRRGVTADAGHGSIMPAGLQSVGKHSSDEVLDVPVAATPLSQKCNTNHGGRAAGVHHTSHQQQQAQGNDVDGPGRYIGFAAADAGGSRRGNHASQLFKTHITQTNRTAAAAASAPSGRHLLQRRQQQQQQQQEHNSTGKHQRASFTGSSGIGYVSAGHHPPGLQPSRPAVHPTSDGTNPWWMVLPDYVPVEVLLQQQVNPRDAAPVFINYKSQFKDGGSSAANGARKTAANRSTASKQSKAKNKRGAAAAAAAAPQGFMSAAQLDEQQQSSGQRRRSKGRKSRSSKGKAGSGSGGKGRRQSSGGGRWSTVGGKKVFINASGACLSGASAWKAYKRS